MKGRRAGRVIPVVLIALLLPLFVYTARTAWGIIRQSDDEQDAFDALAAQVRDAAREEMPAISTDAQTDGVDAASHEYEALTAELDGETVVIDIATLDLEAGTVGVNRADGARETAELARLTGLVTARLNGEPVAADVRAFDARTEALPVYDRAGERTQAKLSELSDLSGVVPVPGAPETSVVFSAAGTEAGDAASLAEAGGAARQLSLVEALELLRQAASQIAPPRMILPRYLGLHLRNADFFGWVKIDDTAVDYPVMFSPEEPERYLHRDFDGEYSYSGTPFIEGNCVEGGNYYIIYAHHMKNGTMFGELPKYAAREYWEAHPVIRFDTLYERREYRVVAAFKSKVYGAREKGVFRYYEFTDLSDPERFEAYMAGVREAALYDTGVEAVFGDEVLALSTCNYHTANGRFVVVAKRVMPEDEP